MELTDHQKRLQRVYASAPIMRYYNTSYLGFTEEGTKLTLQVEGKYLVGENTLHSSVSFRMLDDAAWFACAAAETEHFIEIRSFNVEFVRPVTGGKITAVGTVTNKTDSSFEAKAELFDENEQLVASGTGQIARTDRPWADVFGYSS